MYATSRLILEIHFMYRIVMILLLSSMASANNQSLIFIEGSMGYEHGSVKPSLNYGEPKIQSDTRQNNNLLHGQIIDYINGVSSEKASLHGFSGGIHIGGDYYFKNSRAVIGIMIGGALTTTKGSAIFPKAVPFMTEIFGEPQLTSFDISSEPIKFFHKGYIDAALRLGMSFKKVLFFVKLGFARHCISSRIKIMHGEGNYTFINFKKKWTNAALVGAGIDFNVTNNVVLGCAFNYHFCPKVTFKKYNASEYDKICIARFGGIRFKGRMSFVEALVTLKYVFPINR